MFNPVTFSAALLTQKDAFLFIDEVKLGEDVRQVRSWALYPAPAPSSRSLSSFPPLFLLSISNTSLRLLEYY